MYGKCVNKITSYYQLPFGYYDNTCHRNKQILPNFQIDNLFCRFSLVFNATQLSGDLFQRKYESGILTCTPLMCLRI